MKSRLKELKAELKAAADPEKATLLRGFFKTGKGQYGEGDLFLGITVPMQRKIARKYRDLGMPDLQKLLNSPVHEERLVALLILVDLFERAAEDERGELYAFYISNSNRVNNWDLVDLTAPRIVGRWLERRSRKVLVSFARSSCLWERRIAIVSTLYFIMRRSHADTFRIAEILMNDRHDLIHKATGWMLREVGKRCGEPVLEAFLVKHCRTMPRTMLRYAIERLPEEKRKRYMDGSAGLPGN